MTSPFPSILGVLGITLLNEGFVIKLAWGFCRLDEKKGLASCSFVSFLDDLEIKKCLGF